MDGKRQRRTESAKGNQEHDKPKEEHKRASVKDQKKRVLSSNYPKSLAKFFPDETSYNMYFRIYPQ
jgi:hypothetical protein